MFVYIILGILLIVLATPLVLGLVPPNAWYGIRLAGYATPGKWYAVNRRGGWVFLLLGITLAMAGAALYPAAPFMVSQTRTFLAVLLIPAVIIAAAVIVFLASRIDR